ncbi:hypothetical protein NRK67_01710 [Fusobacteria bacterium ZRK30]|nr:hypothetical protein NRK67_01710 [Fusobacteria bacterium ZRK30]
MKIVKNFCMWSDLLGYGAPLKKSKWQLNTKDAKENLLRITLLEPHFHVRNNSEEVSLVLNDGIIRSLDFKGELDYYERKYLSWLSRAILNYNILNESDIKNNFYGLRSVLSIGDRFSYMNERVSMASNTIAHSSVIETLKKKTAIYSPKEFQMNMAFSKAYIMESSGSRAGLNGNNLFIDIDVLNFIKDYYEDNGHKWNRMKTIDHDDGISSTIVSDWVSVSYKINEKMTEKNFVWSVDMFMEGKQYTLMTLWFDKEKIEYNDNDIQTELYILEKYSPEDEDENFVIEMKTTPNKKKKELTETEIEEMLKHLEESYKERQRVLSNFKNYKEEES